MSAGVVGKVQVKAMKGAQTKERSADLKSLVIQAFGGAFHLGRKMWKMWKMCHTTLGQVRRSPTTCRRRSTRPYLDVEIERNIPDMRPFLLVRRWATRQIKLPASALMSWPRRRLDQLQVGASNRI
jgi:hypothetical protein